MEKSYKLFCSQVSGKQPKLLSQDQKTILKGYSHEEQAFYQYMASLSIMSPAYSLTRYIPQFQGIITMDQIPLIHHNDKVKDQQTLQWLQHLRRRYQIRNPQNKFLVLQNLIHSYKRPNVLDIKLGRKGTKKLKPKKQDFKDFFVLNGCRINVKHFEQQKNNEFEILFFSKYFFKTLKKSSNILEHLALYFFDGEKLRIKLLNKMIEKLREAILSLKTLRGWKFYSTSLCMFYDAQDDTKFDVRLIDFGRSVYNGSQQLEDASIIGLENFHQLLMKVKKKSHQIEEVLCIMKQKYLKEAILIIPDNKIMEYEGMSSRQVSETNSPNKKITEVENQLHIIESD